MNKKELDDFKKKLVNYARIKFDYLFKKLKSDQVVEIDNIKIFLDFFSQGKFIRSYLIKKFFDYYSGKNEQTLFDIALATEIFHSSILIHDDVFDNDYLRRGKKTIFYQYNTCYKKDRDDQLGRSLAIILGDLGFYLSNIFLWQAVKNHKNKSLILETFFYQVIKTAFGEFLDVKSSLLFHNLSIKKINLINRFKTSEYTFNLPFRMGYLLAVKILDKSEIELIDKIGFILGDIYQTKDDLLNFIGESELTGKSVGSDIKENKNTLIKKIIFRNISPIEKEEIKKFYGNRNLSKKEIKRLKEIFFERQIDKKIYTILNNKKRQALYYIKKLKITEEAKIELSQFIDYLIERQR